jgi:hypothetical protein
LKPWLLGSVLTLGAGFAASSAPAPPAASVQEASPWIMDYEAAKAASRKTNKPIFLVIR